MFAACLAYVAAQGPNQYLPPKTGYNYPSPSGQQPSQVRLPAPQPPRPQPPRPAQQDNHVHEPGMPYDFQYQVNDVPSQNDYYHKANSDGDVVRGEYRVAMPDGRTQVVRYTADWKNGYNAEVSQS